MKKAIEKIRELNLKEERKKRKAIYYACVKRALKLLESKSNFAKNRGDEVDDNSHDEDVENTCV